MFQTYFNTIQNHFLADSEFSEVTFRTAIEVFLNTFCEVIYGLKFNIVHEPTKQQDKGRPDFKVSTKKEQVTAGLIETKKIGYDLKSVLNSKQLENYKKLSENIILTDYLHFYLIKKGVPVLDCALFSDYNLQSKRFKVEQSRIDELTRLLKTFFEAEPETITKTKDLALKLSEKAIFLKEYCTTELNTEKDEAGKLEGVYDAFKKILLPILEKEFFADIYAQTLTYGLFLAALNCDDAKKELNKNTAYSLLPSSLELIKELFDSFDKFPSEIIWAIEEIISILKVTDFIAIKKEFAEYRHKEKGFNDPFIFFYEDFLKHYDKKQRELRGVYYTPEPVVSFIVRSIEAILKDTFGINDGFLSNSVTLLDFATGTGTFLLYSFKLALEQAQKLGDRKTVNKLLNERLINNFYGFELLVAPYVVAHLKISEFLKEEGYSIDEGKRLNVFLTNTLTNKEPQNLPLMQSLSKEGREANKIKNKEILVIEGNPPYSVSSSNKTGFIADEKMNRYKGAVKSEKNIQPLSDDYIKFIRFAHWKMENVERGIIGIITNNSFLDGLIHRGMRQELKKDFDEIYILNLHGNSRTGEKSPDGTKDENVFDIMQGVSISFFVKLNKNSNKQAKIYYSDLYGLREIKYSALWENTIRTIDWDELKPTKEYSFFTKKDFSANGNYLNCFKIDNIFNIYTSGIKTHHDRTLVSFKPFKKNNQLYNYRPFDIRNIEYDLIKVIRHRNTVMQHLLKENFGLCLTRQLNLNRWCNVNISNKLTDICFVSIKTKESAYVFPLFFYKTDDLKKENNGNDFLFKEDGKRDNFTKEFRQFFKGKYSGKYEPEDILGYIYAVLHSPTYRTKYIEFLKIDFPRVPFTDNEDLFRELSAIGFELIQNHLLNREYADKISKFHGESDNYKVEKVVFDEKELKVWINKDRYFQPVPSEIWNFHIGGYQVLDKWLKERKKHDIILSGEDIDHFIKVVNILDVTIKTMGKIDDMTREWI